MALSLLFIVDPLDELKAYKDSSVAMMREAAGRGHRVFAATPAELAATGQTPDDYVCNCGPVSAGADRRLRAAG